MGYDVISWYGLCLVRVLEVELFVVDFWVIIRNWYLLFLVLFCIF